MCAVYIQWWSLAGNKQDSDWSPGLTPMINYLYTLYTLWWMNVHTEVH